MDAVKEVAPSPSSVTQEGSSPFTTSDSLSLAHLLKISANKLNWLQLSFLPCSGRQMGEGMSSVESNLSGYEEKSNLE